MCVPASSWSGRHRTMMLRIGRHRRAFNLINGFNIGFNNGRYYSLSKDDIKNQPSLNHFQKEIEQAEPKDVKDVKDVNEVNEVKDIKDIAKPPTFFQSPTPPTPFKPVNTTPPIVPPVLPVKQSKFMYIFYALAFLSTAYIGVDILNALIPSNTDYISEETLELLGKAIENESKNDINKSIEFYLKALKQLDDEEVEHITPCYTSICIRIAQLFEYEKKFDKALNIYKELSECYLNAIVNRDEFSTLNKNEAFDFAILRSLTISIKYANLLPEEDVEIAKENLLFNIVEAQKRIVEHYPPFLSILNDINNRNILSLITSDIEQSISHLSNEEQEKILKEQTENPIVLPLYTTEQTPENKLLGLDVKAWPVFTRVLINAKDMYANLCIESNDLSNAISSLTSNSVIIQRCFDHPSRLTLTLSKLGVVLQMNYENISNNFPKGEDIDILLNNEHMKSDISSSELKKVVLASTTTESKRIFLKVLSLCDTMKKQEQVMRGNNQLGNLGEWEAMFKPALDKSEMVSTASLGMISYQEGKLNDALNYFKRAKILANKLKDNDYVDDINGWIEIIQN